MYSKEERPVENFSGQKDLLQHDIPVYTNESYAGFWLRFAALLIDLIVAITIVTVFIMIFSLNFINASSDEEIESEIIVFYFFLHVGVILYFSLMESSKFQATLGKRAVGIYVTDLSGKKISFLRALGRHFSKLLSAVTIYIGFLMAAFTDQKQGLHDIIAGTLVLKGNKG